MVLVYEAGFRRGRRASNSTQRGDQAFGFLESAALGLVSLLIAFTFSFEAGRYDQRRELVVREANAIGTTFLRAGFLREPNGSKLRALLRRYVDVRLDFGSDVPGSPEMHRDAAASADLQQQLWSVVTDASQHDPRPISVSLVAQALNETIDIDSEATDSIVNRLPPTILVIILIVVLISALIVGLGFGRTGTRAPVAGTLYAILVCLAIFTILDLDRPRRGWIKTDPAALAGLRDTLGRTFPLTIENGK